jgi:hypothetical protein
MKLHDRVVVPRIGYGYITNIRPDALGDLIYTVTLDNPTATPTGIYVARACEIYNLSGEAQ